MIFKREDTLKKILVHKVSNFDSSIIYDVIEFEDRYEVLTYGGNYANRLHFICINQIDNFYRANFYEKTKTFIYGRIVKQ